MEERNRKTKSSFKRVYRKKICVLRDSRLWVVGYKTQAQYASYIAQIKKEHGPDIVILDDMEHDEAFELYSKHLYAWPSGVVELNKTTAGEQNES